MLLTKHNSVRSGKRYRAVTDDFRILGDQLVVVVGDSNFILETNQVGVDLWRIVSRKSVSENELVEALMNKYEAPLAIVANDVKEFLSQCFRAGVVEIMKRGV